MYRNLRGRWWAKSHFLLAPVGLGMGLTESRNHRTVCATSPEFSPNVATKIPRPSQIIKSPSSFRQRKLTTYYNETEQNADDEDTPVERNLPIPSIFSPLGVGACSHHGIEPSILPGQTVKKINQDRGAVVCPYANDDETVLIGVFDGHGDGGEHVSQFAMKELEEQLQKHPCFENDVKRAFTEVFMAIETSLEENPGFDARYCGTTACVLLFRERGRVLYVANLGDSRAVLCRHGVAVPLTKDHKPETKSEYRRIRASGGHVSLGVPPRVWIDASMNYLGLAMSRSFGDMALKKSGVIAEPAVYRRILNQSKDDFIIVASDGVWDCLDSKEAVALVRTALEEGIGATEACHRLVQTASDRWKEQHCLYRDDITAIVVRPADLYRRDEDTDKKTNI